MRRKDCRDVLDSRQHDDADESTEHLGDLGLGIGLNELDDGLLYYLRDCAKPRWAMNKILNGRTPLRQVT